MKLLIFTQKVDMNDTVLSFFHGWIIEFSKNFESIIVVCLYKGKYDLPNNVRVLSLGKEDNVSRLKYLWRFYKYICKERKNYESVFVHMNQEYILFGWKIWKLLGKYIYMWRNHYAGSFLTDIAAFFCTNVFCTSRYSYTAKYKKTVFMPVGIDTDMFKTDVTIPRVSHSVLSLGRISSSKKIDVFVEALGILKNKGIDFTSSIYGDALPKDRPYYELLKKQVSDLGLTDYVLFKSGVPNTETPRVYSGHEIFVNLSQSGMYDKTIFEALACGCMTLASSDDFKKHVSGDFIFTPGDAADLARALEKVLGYSNADRIAAQKTLGSFVESQSLRQLSLRLKESMSGVYK